MPPVDSQASRRVEPANGAYTSPRRLVVLNPVSSSPPPRRGAPGPLSSLCNWPPMDPTVLGRLYNE